MCKHTLAPHSLVITRRGLWIPIPPSSSPQRSPCPSQCLGLALTLGTSTPAAQAVMMTLFCMLFAFAHLIVAPMHEPSQSLQTALLFCLGAIAASAAPFATVMETAGVSGKANSGSETTSVPAGDLAGRWVALSAVLVRVSHRASHLLRLCFAALTASPPCRLQALCGLVLPLAAALWAYRQEVFSVYYWALKQPSRRGSLLLSELHAPRQHCEGCAQGESVLTAQMQ